MARKGTQVVVDRTRWRDDYALGENFYQAAREALDVGFEYWNAIGAVVVHAAIAYMDSVTINRAGPKSKGEDHLKAVDNMAAAAPGDTAAKAAVTQLRRIVSEKNRVSYSGEFFSKREVERLMANLERFRRWVRAVLGVVEPPPA